MNATNAMASAGCNLPVVIMWQQLQGVLADFFIFLFKQTILGIDSAFVYIILDVPFYDALRLFAMSSLPMCHVSLLCTIIVIC